jgi:poly(A)-specific ribonuclease
VQQVRDKLDEFLESRSNTVKHPVGGLNAFDITNRTDLSGAVRELSGFDRRLVHQLIRAEYPQLITMSRSGIMTIRIKNQDREAEHQARRLDRSKAQVRNHIGFRHVIDALCGQDIGDLECYKAAKSSSIPFLESSSSSPDDSRLDAFQSARQHLRIIEALQKRRPAIVGHNVLNDLIYLHHAFINPLPDSVAEFASSVHSYFPIVVDTKYMATYKDSSMNPTSSLAKLDEELALEALLAEKLHLASNGKVTFTSENGTKVSPMIKTEPGFDKYATVESLHEAGYDAFITAKIFIRMAAKYGDGKVPPFTDQVWLEYSNRLRVFGTHETELRLVAE